MRLPAGLVIVLCMLPGHASAASRCPIERAVFAEADAGMLLTFRPVGADAAAVSHHFAMSGGALKLDGHIMYDEVSKRPIGMVMNNCPQGDATGAELAACTVWTGVVYSLDKTADKTAGQIDIVGQEGSEAPDALLMPGFGPAVRHAANWEKFGLRDVPWDLFEFKQCAAE